MLKKILIIMLLCIAGMNAKAQYVHYGTSENSNPSGQDEPAQIVTGYVIDPSNNNVQRVKLKVKTVDQSITIISVKQMSDQYWTDLVSTPPIAHKIYSYEAYSDQFEYKVYIAVLGKVVYF
jgi:hypothetical protein